MHQLLKSIRKGKGVTQGQILKATGISLDRLTGIEQGTGKLSINELQAYLSAIDATALILPNSIINAAKS